MRSSWRYASAAVCLHVSGLECAMCHVKVHRKRVLLTPPPARPTAISKVNPTRFTTEGGTLLTITGSDFGSAHTPPTVTIGGAACVVEQFYLTSTQIVCATPTRPKDFTLTSHVSRVTAPLVVKTFSGKTAFCRSCTMTFDSGYTINVTDITTTAISYNDILQVQGQLLDHATDLTVSIGDGLCQLVNTSTEDVYESDWSRMKCKAGAVTAGGVYNLTIQSERYGRGRANIKGSSYRANHHRSGEPFMLEYVWQSYYLSH